MSEETTTTITPHLCCRNATEALGFYEKAFGAETACAFRMPNGKLMHAGLNVNGAQFFLTDECPEHGALSPEALGGSPVTIHLHVPDSDAVFQRAVDAGCQVRMPLQDMFWGDRYGLVADPYGHLWSIATSIRKVSTVELQEAVAAMAGA